MKEINMYETIKDIVEIADKEIEERDKELEEMYEDLEKMRKEIVKLKGEKTEKRGRKKKIGIAQEIADTTNLSDIEKKEVQ